MSSMCNQVEDVLIKGSTEVSLMATLNDSVMIL